MGRDTPANAATCFFNRPSAYYNTIRALLDTGAGTSALSTISCNSARYSAVSSQTYLTLIKTG
jgi:hypothetical protein